MRQQAPPGTGPGQSVPSQYWQQQQQQLTYAEHEMMSSPYQQQPAGYYQQGPPQGQYQQQQHQSSQPNSRTHSLVPSPVAEHNTPAEYYGVAAAQPSAMYGPPSSPPSGQPMPQVRRLHSEGYRRRDTVPGIPEANSPVNSAKPDDHSENSAMQAPAQRTVASPARPTMTTRQSSNYSQSSVVVSPVMSQAPDNFPQAPGRQDYQTQYWQHQTQPAQGNHALPPLQTHSQPMRQQPGGVGSIDQQVARSPAMDYQDQQTPWSISLPRGEEGPNRNSYAQQSRPARSPPPAEQYYTGPPPATRGAIRSSPPTPRYQDQYSAMTPYHFVPPQQIQNPIPQNQQRSSSHYGEQVSSPVEYSNSPQERTLTPAQHYQNAYGHARPQQQQLPQHQQQQQRNQPPQTRYYSQQQQQSGPRPQQQHESRPLTYQRTPSGYSGRRDDAAVSEANLMGLNASAHMRGASYPGQEWVPGR